MNFADFTGEVQHRIEAGTQAEAVRTTRAVLETLGERLTEGEATDVASPLPMEVDRYLLQVKHGEKYDREQFIDRVVEKLNYRDIYVLSRYSRPAEVDRAEAVYRIKALFALLSEELQGSEMDGIEQQLPEEYQDLFDFVEMENQPWQKE